VQHAHLRQLMHRHKAWIAMAGPEDHRSPHILRPAAAPHAQTPEHNRLRSSVLCLQEPSGFSKRLPQTQGSISQGKKKPVIVCNADMAMYRLSTSTVRAYIDSAAKQRFHCNDASLQGPKPETSLEELPKDSLQPVQDSAGQTLSLAI
jgi:hypothetical protein